MTVPARMFRILIASAFIAPLFADTTGLANTGGTMTLGGSFVIASSAVAAPAGALFLNCPITSTGIGTYVITYTCSGGSLNFASSDGTTTISASFTNGTLTFSGSGGGRGNHSKYWYSFSGNFAGVLVRNGVSEAIIGGSNQLIGPLPGQIGSGSATVSGGTTGAIPSYTPFYFTNGSQVLRSSDLLGTDLAAYGTTGTGIHQFYGAAGVALDQSGRIYVADAINDRIVRIDDLTGKNWTTFGSYGAGARHFHGPNGIAVDSAGRIYVADTSNNRIVRFDDMSGTNWVAWGAAGAGAGQFQGPLSVSVDAAGHIFIPDTGNSRIVRIDDMTGANWTTLTQSPNINGYIYLMQSPVAVAFDPAGRIYIGQSTGVGSTITRVDDMTGANWSTVYTGNSMTGMSADASGNVFASGTSLAAIEGFGYAGTVSTVFGTTHGIAMVPVPAPVPAAVSVSPLKLTYTNQNTGTSSVAQTVTLTNFGGSPLALSQIGSTAGDFSETNTCGSSLAGGENCAVSVTFSPLATGVRNGALTISDNSANAGALQSVALSGVGTAPVVSVAPGSLAFPAQVVATASAAQEIVVRNTGSGALEITNFATGGDFAQSNNCGASLSPGTACAILVTFTPAATGPRTGFLALTDSLGTQTVTLTGTGVSTAPSVTVSPASLVFPEQQLNTVSALQTVTLSNTGAAAVTVISATISGDFARTSTCPATLKPKSACSVRVTFKPAATGVRSGTLTLNLSSGALTVGLTGTGDTSSSPPSLTVSPGSLDFAGYTVGDNPSQTVVVTNTNGVTAGISGISLTGNPPYSQANTCAKTLAAGASCSIEVTFQPSVVGTFTGSVAVKESSGFTHVVSITGTAASNN